MYLDLNDIVIRDFEKKDIVSLREIVLEKNIVRFMGDWTEVKSLDVWKGT